MKINQTMTRLKKITKAFKSLQLITALARYQVLAASDTRYVSSRELSTVVDIGVNRGQFVVSCAGVCACCQGCFI